jgi:hypothetical protein
LAEKADQELGGGAALVAEVKEKTLALIRPQLHEDAFAGAWQEGQPLTVDDGPRVALDSID